jgi:hypothetical protein
VLEFKTAVDDKGRRRAVNVSVMKPAVEERTRARGPESEAEEAPAEPETPEEGPGRTDGGTDDDEG